MRYTGDQAFLLGQHTEVNHHSEKSRISSHPWKFACEWGLQFDTIMPSPGTSWNKRVYDDAPSTFGFYVWPGAAGQGFSLRDVKIALRK